MVVVQSATFYNPYKPLKKGYLQFGETVEDIFVAISKVVEYNPEKGEQRELKRYMPDVQTVFHVMNWRVMYPVTIQNEDLKLAFLSMEGVQDLIAKIVDSVYTAAEYDEFLLFKYLLIKTISKGTLKAVSIGDGTDLDEAAIQFRGFSNDFTFMNVNNNPAGVKNNTPKDRQVIFMDSFFNARFDVKVLADAFNMEKADFMGRLFLIDNWTTFDNERFETIRQNSDGIEEVTQEELALLGSVKAVLLDERFFQVYDNNNMFTEKYVSSGPYWNYFYHVWKTVSYSPFANAVVFVTDNADITLPATFDVTVSGKEVSDVATIYTLSVIENTTLKPHNISFIQTKDLVTQGIAMQEYGAIIIPSSLSNPVIAIVANIAGQHYTTESVITSQTTVGTTITMTKEKAAKAAKATK